MSSQAIGAEAPQPKPFLKWAGGKRKLAPEIMKLFPEKFGTYYEPFLGGGAVFLALQPKRAVLSDVNEELIQTWKAIKHNPEALIDQLETVQELYNDRDDHEAFYLRERSRYKPAVHVDCAARMIFLNRTCFNGLYRVNKSGKFNVPWGQRESVSFDYENLRAVSAALQAAELRCCDFAYIKPRKGDLVYLDPPYVPLNPTSTFTTYTPGGFGEHEQARLAGAADVWVRRGVHVVISNSNTPLVRKLYPKSHWKHHKVRARRNINSKGNKRGPVTELLITQR